MLLISFIADGVNVLHCIKAAKLLDKLQAGYTRRCPYTSFTFTFNSIFNFPFFSLSQYPIFTPTGQVFYFLFFIDLCLAPYRAPPPHACGLVALRACALASIRGPRHGVCHSFLFPFFKLLRVYRSAILEIRYTLNNLW